MTIKYMIRGEKLQNNINREKVKISMHYHKVKLINMNIL